MRWLEEVEPVVDLGQVNAAVEYHEQAWELEQIERSKVEHEAAAEEEGDPLVLEGWDQGAADNVYRRQVPRPAASPAANHPTLSDPTRREVAGAPRPRHSVRTGTRFCFEGGGEDGAGWWREREVR